MSQLWANETSGNITCQDHAGGYLTAAIGARPKARTHSTPLGKWVAMSPEWVADMVAEFGSICDGCKR